MGLTWKYIKRVVKKINNDDFKRFVLELDTNPYLVEFKKLGDKLPEKNVLIIKNDDSGHGFFAEYRMTLNYIAFADRYHFEPYVLYDKSYRYAETGHILGTDNPFEYYYEQPSKLAKSDVLEAHNVVFARNAHGDMAESLNEKCCSYEISEEYISYMADITQKYIRLNATTKRYLENEIQKILGNTKVLGIHYRGTDFKQNYNNHPVAVTVEKEIEIAKDLLQKYSFDKVFLATDDMQAIQRFSEAFGDKLVYYDDVYRGSNDVSVAFSNDSRENHHYHLGLEVLRDMYTLAACDGLIAGMSQVSNIARITKRATGHDYQVVNIINQGINSNNKKFMGEKSG
jgi:hypothetical protein